jgi:hypothetical protein
MKHGISLSINVKEIEKARLYQGKKGVYLSMTVFVDTENQDQYGNHGMITQDVSKEEREQGVKGAILGNAKVFWTGNSEQRNYQQPQNGYQQNQNQGNQQNQGYQQQQNQGQPQDNNGQDEIPF